MEDSSLFMIAMYQQKSYAEVIKALEDWYQFGRFDANRFIGEYDVDIHDSKVLEEYARHIRWKEISGVKATPTLILSGHQLPAFYQVEDLIYLDM